jgi:hypothetical protein
MLPLDRDARSVSRRRSVPISSSPRSW